MVGIERFECDGDEGVTHFDPNHLRISDTVRFGWWAVKAVIWPLCLSFVPGGKTTGSVSGQIKASYLDFLQRAHHTGQVLHRLNQSFQLGQRHLPFTRHTVTAMGII